MAIFWAAHEWKGVKKGVPLSKNLSYISYNDILYLTVIPYLIPYLIQLYITLYCYTLPKEDTKMYESRDTRVLLTSTFFYQKLESFDISRNTDIDSLLVHNF